MKQDITMHSDAELSLIVFNDETLYNMRRNRRNLIQVLTDLYFYNDNQLSELENDLDEDKKE